ncbi:MIP18 family protein [Striga hermonthica]|uniref:MIP18 family protein n=1 Tax=Striga hermonthica TaxID=68872 RepID=A0A9N7NVF8_STRHE|nr:MIP18 family protein [Striga hermonthica]
MQTQSCTGKRSVGHAVLQVMWMNIQSSRLTHIRDIKDPEHPYTLEDLNVISEDAIEVDNERSHIRVTFTPTVQHCSMATVIGLCLQVKLMRSLPSRFKVDIRVAPGTHATEAAVNKQLHDKERVAAALENPNLVNMVDECLAPSYE